MQEIYKNIYRKIINLPNTPLRTLNFYIIHSQGQTLAIDTGFRNEEGLQDFKSAIETVGATLNKTRLFITHGHSDHCGLCGILQNDLQDIYMGENEAREMHCLAKVPKRMEIMLRTLDLERYFSKAESADDKFQHFTDFNYIPVKEGNIIRVGEYNFIPIETPGHTPGHMCLYEPEHKIMFTGDHVLGRISPNIAFWGFEYNDILQAFFDSLNKIKAFDVELPLGAHREFSCTLAERTDQLLEHHQERLTEMEGVLLKNEWLSVTEIASQMKWALRVEGGWKNFPTAQKTFAALETMSHLIHLSQNGRAELGDINGMSVFKK